MSQGGRTGELHNNHRSLPTRHTMYMADGFIALVRGSSELSIWWSERKECCMETMSVL